MGWNGSGSVGTATVSAVKPNKSTPPRKSGGKTTASFILGAVALLVIVGIVVIMLPRDKPEVEEPDQDTSKAYVEDVSKKIPPKPIVEEDKKPQVDPEKEALRAKLKNMTPEERREFAFKMMQEREIDLTPTTNRPFRTGIELSMARIFMTRVGDPPPPLLTTFIPIQDEAHLAEILIADNPVIEGDSDEVKDAKATVEMVKKEMMAYIKDGGSPEDFMSYYHSKLQSAFEERRDSIREVARVAIEEPEIAQAFYEKVNKELESKGIAPIELTDKQKERLGLE